MRPEVRIVQNQEESSQQVNIDNWEAEQLLRKYGYGSQQASTTVDEQQQDNGLTFEEMVRQSEQKAKDEQNRIMSLRNGPKPSTFDGRYGYDSQTTYSSDEDTGFGFKIEIVTDMKLPKNY